VGGYEINTLTFGVQHGPAGKPDKLIAGNDAQAKAKVNQIAHCFGFTMEAATTTEATLSAY
jgi:predicted dinucleotide-binding enzyme